MVLTDQHSQQSEINNQKLITQTDHQPKFAPLPLNRPLLLVGHGTRDEDGRQTFLDFAATYQKLDLSRPVIPCFLELTEPNIQVGINQCLEAGHTEISVVPLLLFAARHNKFDITNELDRGKAEHPELKFYYGRHFGIHPLIIDLWKSRLEAMDHPTIPRSETVLLFVGRGSSDPDANGDVYKMARILWEGSGYKTVETCFIGITHPRLEEGFNRARLYQPKRIIVLPYFLFTGALVKKIFDITAQQQELYPAIDMQCLAEMGTASELLTLLREREIETQLGQVQMNCEMCKFRLSAIKDGNNHGHHHDHSHHDHGHHHNHDHHAHDHHTHDHGHHHDHAHHNHSHDAPDPYADLSNYHDRIWQVP